MMENLPIDTSHPAVRDYMALVRLQVLTPLSLLINIATLMVCALVVDPGLAEISRMYPSAIAPQPHLIGVYILAIYIGQLGYCILLVVVRKPETKNAIVRGVGMPLVLSNWIMAAWAVTWVFQAFIASTVLLGILLVILIYANIVLLIYHAPTRQRPFDVALIHAPMRAFMILPLGVLFPYSLFLNLGWYWEPGEPQYYAHSQWAGFGVMLGVNLLGLAVVIFRRDIVWCVSAAWIDASIWSRKPKPFPVFIVVVIFTVIHPLALVASALWVRFHGGSERRRGPIALPEDREEDHSGNPRSGQRGGSREVDAEALWG